MQAPLIYAWSQRRLFYRSAPQVAAPLELNEQDAEHLRDTQTCQIFWNCVATEAVVQFLWSGTSTATECAEPDGTGISAGAGEELSSSADVGGNCTAGSLKIVTMVITGMFAAACLIVTAIVCRIAFRLGNRPCGRRWVRLWRHASM